MDDLGTAVIPEASGRLNAQNGNGNSGATLQKMTVIIDNINHKTYYFIDGSYKNSRTQNNDTQIHTTMIWGAVNNKLRLNNVSYGEIAPSNFINGSDTIVAGAVNTYTSAWTDTELGLPTYKLQLAETPAGVTFSNGTLKVEDWTEASSVTIQAVANSTIDATSTYPNSPIAEKVVTITKNAAPVGTNLSLVTESGGSTTASLDGNVNYQGKSTILTGENNQKKDLYFQNGSFSNAKNGDYLKISFDVTIPDADTAFYFQPYTSKSGVTHDNYMFYGSQYIGVKNSSSDPGSDRRLKNTEDSTTAIPTGTPITINIYLPLQDGGQVKSGGYGTAVATYNDGTPHTLRLDNFSLTGEAGATLTYIEYWYRGVNDSTDYEAKIVPISNSSITLYTSNLFSKTVTAEQIGTTYQGDDDTTAQAYKADFALDMGKTYAAPTVEWQVTNSVGTYRRSKTYDNVAAENAEDSYYGLVITYGDDDGYIENPTVSATFESASVTDTSTN